MKKVLLITDSYNWATYFRAVNLKDNLSSFDFTITSFHDIDKYNFKKFDTVYVLNWPIYSYIKHKISNNRNYRLVAGVSSHIGRPNASKMTKFFSIFDSIGVSNKFLLKEFKRGGISGVVYTPFGVNHNIFKKNTDPNDYKNVFGWVGNKTRSVKRYREIKKTFNELGPKYKLVTVGQGAGFSRERMSEFYNSIGTIICYSSSEGTPNPVLEAAMCGRSVISTNVGNVPELMSRVGEFRPVVSRKSLRNSIVKHARCDLNDVGGSIHKIALRHWTWRTRSKGFVPLIGGSR